MHYVALLNEFGAESLGSSDDYVQRMHACMLVGFKLRVRSFRISNYLFLVMKLKKQLLEAFGD